jgi:hypothetical protein
MRPEAPPRWLQRMLLLFLAPRNRETVSGDLLEAYREEQAPRFGVRRANLWYLRQLISFVSIRIWGGSRMKQFLVLLCLFAAAAGAWLGVMENVLKHDGYTGRTAIAVCIATQAVATLLCLLLHSRAVFRGLVLTGAAGIVLLGASALWRIGHAPHFEGFVFLIGSALILQGALTVPVLLRVQNRLTA